MSSRTKNRCGFTIVELLVVIGLIALLIGILLPALGAVISSGKMTKSMNNMRQVATWMTLYSGDNREFILPSQFDYSGNSYSGKVRAPPGYSTSDRCDARRTTIPPHARSRRLRSPRCSSYAPCSLSPLPSRPSPPRPKHRRIRRSSWPAGKTAFAS